MRDSLSRMTTEARGYASVRASVVARPTMPPPMTAMSGMIRSTSLAGDPGRVSSRIPAGVSEAKAARRASVELERDGAVVRALHRREDTRGAHACAKLVANEEIVDAPADVPRPRAGLEIPPRVVSGVSGEEPERVVVPAGDEPAHPGALDRHEAGVPLVLPRAREVERGVGGIDVSADHDALALPAQVLDVLEELGVERELVRETLGAHPAVGKVHVEQVERVQLGVDDTPLRVEARAPALRGHGERLGARVRHHSAVAPPLREAPGRAVALGSAHVVGDLLLLELGLLRTQDVRPLGPEQAEEPLLPRRPETVDVPGDELQRRSGSATVRSLVTFPVLTVVFGSSSTTCTTSVSATGQCSTPRGTTMNSPGPTSRSPVRKRIDSRPSTTRNNSSSCS